MINHWLSQVRPQRSTSTQEPWALQLPAPKTECRALGTFVHTSGLHNLQRHFAQAFIVEGDLNDS